ncbi:hypothetical protein MMC11_008538 [Xylographa trunciseda]|nr:hypothetical protein [Xylographa trunciseda]
MSGQWPQHTPSQAGYAYPGYQQHYPQQQFVPATQQYQYGPQPIPYQNFSSARAEPYQQPPQYQQAPPYKQPLAQPTPDTCYNCGSPEHWAQNCPESRREVPAGDLTRSSVARPTKKFRPNYIPPVITKYAVPPNVQNNHGSPQGYGALPYEQPVIAQHYAIHGQPTPVSANSPPRYQYPKWPETNQPPVHQIAQTSYNNNTYPQPQYSYHGPPANLPYGQHYTSPVSPEVMQQTHGSYPSYGPAPQLQGPSNSTYPTIPPSGTGTSFPTTRSFSESSNGMAARHSYSQLISNSSPAGNARPQSTAQQSDDVEEDDMDLLDIPDLPDDVTYYGGCNTRLIQYPLPTSAEDFEALGGLLPFPESHGDDHIKSRYVDRENLKSFLEHSTYEEDNDLEGGDPVFFHTSRHSLDVPLEILIESRGRLTSSELRTVLLGGHEETANTIRRPGSAYSEDHGYRTHPIMSPIESPNFYTHDRSSRRRSLTSGETEARPAISAQETEDRLAALGVTGAPKPVRAPARPYPPPSSHGPINSIPFTASYENHRRDSHNSGQRSSSKSRSPQKINVPIHEHNRVYPIGQHSPRPLYDGNRTPTYHRADPPAHDRARTPAYQPDHIKAWASTEHDPFDPEDKDPDELLYPDHPNVDTSYDQFNPPPPPQVPPPSKRTVSDLLSNRDGPLSPGSYKNRHNSHSIYGPDHDYSYHQSESPVKLKSERSYDRKRSRDQKDDDSDDEQHKERRRQHDDVTPKLKRRQPKVAEAYSRRW